ncbi:hypothetical protein TrRE_jg8739, partial [Triparma retinervis]
SLPPTLADAHELILKLQARVKELEHHQREADHTSKSTIGKLHDELAKDGVCKLDVIDKTRLVQQAALVAVLHDEPNPVLDFLLSDNSKGVFTRVTVETTESSRIVLWKHLNRGQNIEYLLRFSTHIPSSTNSDCAIKMNSVSKESLSKEALAKYKRFSSSHKSITGKVTNGMIKISPYPYGQSAVMFTGNLESDDKDVSAKSSSTGGRFTGLTTTIRGQVSGLTRKSRASGLGSFRSTFRASGRGILGIGNLLDREVTIVDSNTNRVKRSIVEILYIVQSHFKRPDVIDKRIRQHFMDEIMPKAPPLTVAEVEKLKKSREIQKLTIKAKRLPGMLRVPVEKYLWTQVKANNLTVQWGLSVATIDISAKALLAQLFEINTYSSAAEHNKKQPHLHRVIKRNIDGTRSTQYSVGMAFPPPLTARAFESWLTWTSFQQEDGETGYICFFMPMNAYPEPYERHVTANQKEGESNGCYIIHSLAPNICRWTRIQNVDLNLNVHPKLMSLVTKRELIWANNMQEMHRRNEAEVDAEMRAALIKKLRDTELDSDQKETVKYLKTFFEMRRKMDASQEIDTSVQAPMIKRIKALQISYDLKSSDEKFADVVGMESNKAIDELFAEFPPPPKLVPTFQISRPLHATSPTPSLSDDGLVLVDGGGDLLYSESPPTVEIACDYVGNKNNNSRKSSRQEVRKTESQHPLKLLDRGASFMDHTFSSKMQRVDALCDDELGEADWADAPEIPEDPEFLGAQQAKAKPTKKKKEAPTSPDDVEEQFVIKPLETVEDYRKGKKPKDPYPLPSSSPQLSDSELLSEVSTKATAFLSAAKQHPLSPGASQPPLPSEMWDLIKEGYEAKVAKVRRQERRRGRSDERKKIMEKSLIERLNESEGGLSNAEPELMVDRAVTRALAGDVLGAKLMLQNGRDKRTAALRSAALAHPKGEGKKQKKKKKPQSKRKPKAIKRPVYSDSGSDSSCSSATSASESTASMATSFSGSSTTSSSSGPDDAEQITRTLSSTSKSIHATINSIEKIAKNKVVDPSLGQKPYHQTPTEVVEETLPFQSSNLAVAVDEDMLELKRIQSRLSYQLGRLSSTLGAAANAAKAETSEGAERLFLLGQTGLSVPNVPPPPQPESSNPECPPTAWTE